MEIVAYKLFKLKDGKLFSLFINNKTEIITNTWLQSDCFPTKGFAVRQGWHCCYLPIAPHLKTELANGEKRVWVECMVEGVVEYFRPESQGGVWVLADQLMVNKILTDNEVKEIRNTK